MSLYGSGIYPFWCFHNSLSISVKSITYKTCSEFKINEGNHSTRTLLNISQLFKSCCKLNCLWLCYIVVTLSPLWCRAGPLDLFLCLFARRLHPGWWGNVQKYFFTMKNFLLAIILHKYWRICTKRLKTVSQGHILGFSFLLQPLWCWPMTL